MSEIVVLDIGPSESAHSGHGAIVLNLPRENVHVRKPWKLWKLAVDSSQFAFIAIHL